MDDASPTADSLSRAAQTVWAKYDEASEEWLPLYKHLTDTAEVAALLWDEWLPRNAKDAVAASLPGGAADAKILFCWLAGIHDVGKASPPFAVKVQVLLTRMIDEGLNLPIAVDSRLGRHWTVGQVVLEDWLRHRHRFSRDAARALGCVVGGHHGEPPDTTVLEAVRDRPQLLGSPPWSDVREELLGFIGRHTGATDRLADWREVLLPKTVQVLLSAGVIVADWIASNQDYFPLFGPDGGDDSDRATLAWKELALPPPWTPTKPPRDPEQHLTQRFPFIFKVRPVQASVVQQAWSMPGPGVMVVEAPMGIGKTEAALAAAEVLAYRFHCGGLIVALPTMATTDAMFGRVLAWVRSLPSPHQLSMYLAHSKAALNDEAGTLPRHCAGHLYDEQGKASAAAVAMGWLSGRKKGVLSTFVVATIDQVLFGALRSRHLALRHLALAGKVVIVDEVHAADAYMRAYLCRALQWLGAYGTPVVLLSATLPPDQREELLNAYESGRRPPQPAKGNLDDLC